MYDNSHGVSSNGRERLTPSSLISYSERMAELWETSLTRINSSGNTDCRSRSLPLGKH